jgi:hypothetical protein
MEKKIISKNVENFDVNPSKNSIAWIQRLESEDKVSWIFKMEVHSNLNVFPDLLWDYR